MKVWRRNSEGKFYCDGDCTSWSFGICTCGLIHHFMGLAHKTENLAMDRKHQGWHEQIKGILQEKMLEDEPDFRLKHNCRHGVDLNEDCEKCWEEVNKLLEELNK